MKNSPWQYLLGAVLIAFSIFQITKNEFWEFLLYFSSGGAFIIMALIQRDVFPRHKKLMTVLSWIFILTAGFVLLFLARTDF